MGLTTHNCNSIDQIIISREFNEYRLKCDKMRQLQTDLEDANRQLITTEQLVTVFTVLQNPNQLHSCQEAVLYFKRLIAEIVSS